MSDPLADLAPFLEAGRATAEDESPPDYLTSRLIASRQNGLGPASSPVPEEDLPRPFGPYSLEKILGRGASGTVYQAHDPELNRQIAVKILSPELALLPESRERFLREAQAAASLQHENLMPVFAVHQDTPFPSLTMPLLEGETLQQKLDRDGPFSDQLLIEVARQITTALQAAHQQNILHRDLKPSNIFFETASQRAIVMDFGLARSLHQPSDLTLSGTIAGTPEFLAPEQIDDEPNLTPTTDLYGLGATLYSLATGQPPFSGHSLTGLLKKVATAQPAPLKDRPTWLNQLIQNLLAKKPSDRPSSATQVLSHLTNQSLSKKSSSGFKKVLLLCGVLALLVIAIDLFASHQQRQKIATFSLSEALQSPSETIIIPKAGIYHLDPLSLNRPLKIVASEPGTILRFTSPSTPITTSASLTFKNLTLRDDLSNEEEARPLILTSGDILNFQNCRLEQVGREATPLTQPCFISAQKPLHLTLENSNLIAFRTPFLQSTHPAKLTLKNSLALVPALLRADESGGHQVTMDQVRAVCLNLILAPPQGEPTRFSVNSSLIEVNHVFLWVPGATSENLEQTVQWTGDHNRFATTRGWLSTSLNRRRNPQRSETDLRSLDQWQNFWNSDQNSREVEATIIPQNLTRDGEHPSEIDLDQL